MGVLGSVFGGTFLATRGGGKQQQQQREQGPPVQAGSKDEEQFIQCVLTLCTPLGRHMLIQVQGLPEDSGRRRSKGPAVKVISARCPDGTIIHARVSQSNCFFTTQK